MLYAPITPKPCALDAFSRTEAEHVAKYHESLPQYIPTPLVSLCDTAEDLGLAGLFVKDESKRFGLHAFKGLGASYALARWMQSQLPNAPLDFSSLLARQDELGKVTFVTATDGNHGHGLAWAVRQFGQKSVVYMPRGSQPVRLAHIQKAGADACICETNYDDTVRFASEQAETQGWILVQDTAWAGYETIPRWIMQGYGTMAKEAVETLSAQNKTPTHVFLQAGVGAMAGGVTAFLAGYYGKHLPKIILVEPKTAACLYETAKANDGNLHPATGNLETIMAGLACGEVCTLAWEILQAHATGVIACDDALTCAGMRLLARPVGQDMPLVSGESGAVCVGVLERLLRDPAYGTIRQSLGLDASSVVLCFSTEGDSDPVAYQKIVSREVMRGL